MAEAPAGSRGLGRTVVPMTTPGTTAVTAGAGWTACSARTTCRGSGPRRAQTPRSASSAAWWPNTRDRRHGRDRPRGRAEPDVQGARPAELRRPASWSLVISTPGPGPSCCLGGGVRWGCRLSRPGPGTCARWTLPSVQPCAGCAVLARLGRHGSAARAANPSPVLCSRRPRSRRAGPLPERARCPRPRPGRRRRPAPPNPGAFLGTRCANPERRPRSPGEPGDDRSRQARHPSRGASVESRLSTDPGGRQPGTDSRDFDYGVGDDLRSAQQQVRAEVAARIRQAARLDPDATSRERQAYELAALIAEGRR